MEPTTSTTTARDELAQLVMMIAVHPDLLDYRHNDYSSGAVCLGDARRIADKALAAGYRKPRTIETVEELDALPVGSVVLARWSNGSQPDYQMTRCPKGGASAGGGFGVAGGDQWRYMANWGATLTVLWEPSA